ncbi:MAG: hypothetical protein WA877_00475, partial [Legionella sp.]
MKSIQLVWDEHLKNLRQELRESVIRNVELSETTYPLLVAYLYYLRKLNSIPNTLDDFAQNTQILHEIIYLCEHNLLFFLIVTGQFNVTRDLFQNKTELTKIVVLWNIKKEYNKALFNKQLIQSKYTVEKTNHNWNKLPVAEWDEAQKILITQVIYQYYEQKLQRLTFNFYVTQEKCYSNTVDEGLKVLNLAAIKIKANKHITPSLKEACLLELTILKNILLEKKAILVKEFENLTGSEFQNPNLVQKFIKVGKDSFNIVNNIR